MAWLSKKRSHWMDGATKGVSFNRYGYVKLPQRLDSVEFNSPTKENKKLDVS